MNNIHQDPESSIRFQSNVKAKAFFFLKTNFLTNDQSSENKIYIYTVVFKYIRLH